MKSAFEAARRDKPIKEQIRGDFRVYSINEKVADFRIIQLEHEQQMQEDRLPSKVILYRHGEVGFKENEMARYD
jgi:hypothetical protein